MLMRQPGVEPGSTAWKATMLTATPLTLDALNLAFAGNKFEYRREVEQPCYIRRDPRVFTVLFDSMQCAAARHHEKTSCMT